MSRRSSIIGTQGARSYRRPTCKKHGTPATRIPQGWVCAQCQIDIRVAKETAKVEGRSLEGMVLPSGVRDERVEDTVRAMVQPMNRRMRRARR